MPDINSVQRRPMPKYSQHKILPEGARFGRLTITSRPYRIDGSPHAHYDCQCDCGGTISTAGSALRTGRTVSCGCRQREARAENGRRNGKKKGGKNAGKRLTVKGETKTVAEWAEITGLAKDTILKRLRKGMSPQEAIETPKWLSGPRASGHRHGLSGTRLYLKWQKIRSECTPCWSESPEPFVEWAKSSGWAAGKQICRKEQTQAFSPENCYVANPQQALTLTVDGVTRTLTEWSELTGVRRATIRNRMKRGCSPKEALMPTRVD